MHELCDVYACIAYFPMYCIGPPSPFTGTPSEETVLDVYRGGLASTDSLKQTTTLPRQSAVLGSSLCSRYIECSMLN